MKKILIVLTTLLIAAFTVSWFQSQPIFDENLDAATLDSVDIVAPETAITLARTVAGETVLVIAADGAGITGIALTARDKPEFRDAIEAYQTVGQVQLLSMTRNATGKAYSWDELVIPIEENYPHIAVGTNYSAHAEEVGLDGEPFLFPKLSRASAWNADVLNIGRLDYEVEICMVPMSDHSMAQPAQLAYLLCGDYTDRWGLIKHIDTDGPLGQTGFPIAKGGTTHLPVGALLVIPQPDDEAFYRSLDMSLYLNDALRQRTTGDLMVWSPSEILTRTLEDCEPNYITEAEPVRISDCTVIPARTIILTGTPGGVMFKLSTIWNPFSYLRNGDTVISKSNWLGQISNKIVAE